MKTLACILIAALLALTGCATPPATHGSIITTDGGRVTENRSDYANYTQAKLTLASKPLFEMECPPEGCVIKALRVNNPNGGGDIAAPAAPPKAESAAVGVAREFKETLLGLTPFAIAYTTGKTVAKLFETSNNANVALASHIQAPQAPQANQTINVNGSNSAAAFGGAASSTGPVTNTTSTVTRTATTNTTTNTNSGNTTTTTATNTNSGNTTTTTTTPTTITCTNGNASGTPTTGTGTGTTTQTCR